MNRGYIRVSTKWQEQGTSLADRRAALEAEGCQEIYEDVYSGASRNSTVSVARSGVLFSTLCSHSANSRGP